jgi:outer membrane immunogenic protein
VIGGGHLGYNLQFGPWVAGIEGTIDGKSLNKTALSPFGFIAVRDELPVQGSIQAHIGYALWDRVLVYATGGAAFVGIDNTYFDTTGVLTHIPFTSEKISRTRSGWTVGGGIAYALTDNWSVRVEYRYTDFGIYNSYPFATFVPFGGLLQVRQRPDENQVQFGVSYKFGPTAPAPVVAKY